jgi:WD40 repeat protein
MLHSRVAGLLLCLALVGVPALVAEQPGVDSQGEPVPSGAITRLGTTRFQQGGVIRAVAFSPDGMRIASAGEDAYVRLWDPATGQQASESTRHYHGVSFLTYSRDGKHIASVSAGAVRILDAATGKETRILRYPKKTDAYLGPVDAAAFSPDGATLATGANAKEIQLWATASGEPGHRLKGHTQRVTSLLYSRDGKILASASDDATIILWDAVKGKAIRTLDGHEGRIFTLALSPDGKVLASGAGDGSVRFWDPGTGEETLHIDTGEKAVFGLTFAPDGKAIATGGDAGVVRLWDVSTGKELRQMELRRGGMEIQSVTFAPDGKTLAAADGTTQIRLWDPATGKARHPDEGHQSRITTLVFAPDGKTLVSGGNGEAPRLWDLASGKVLRQYAESGNVRAVAFAPDGRFLTTVTADRRVRRWQEEKEVGLFRREVYEEAQVALSPDGRLVAWSDLLRLPEKNGWERFIGVWDTVEGKELVRTPSPEYQVYAMALSPDGRTLLSTGSMDRTVGLWETATGKQRVKWPGPSAGVSAAAFSPDGRLVVTGGWDNLVWVRDLATGKQLYRVPQAGTIQALAVSPDGRLVVSAGGGHRAIIVRDLGTGKELQRFSGHRGDIWAVAFSADGRRLASGGDDGVVLVWEVSTAQKQAVGPRLAPLPAGDLKTLWGDLASEDAEKAHRAVWTLSAMPKESVDFLKERLLPQQPDPARLKRLLAALDDDDFDEREKAQKELESLGFLVHAALRKTLETTPSAEVRLRISRLLRRLEGSMAVEELRSVRSIEVLERLGTPEARAVLEGLAKGAADARLTRNAKVALERLVRRVGP